MKRFYRSILWTGIVAAGLVGCGDDVTVVDPPPPPPPPPPQVRSVTVAPDGVQVSPGQTIQMTAAVTADAGCNAAVTWSVSDATRASVSAAGLVTIAAAAASGPVAVRATATCATGGSTGNGVATLNVVGTTVTRVTVTPAQATINAGTATSAPQTLQASAVVEGTNNPSQAVTWTSLDPTIATVNATGLVTANANGIGGPVNIRACSNADNTKCGFLALTVVVPAPATVQIRSVTFVPSGGGGSIPVVLTNVFGQIEIELNIEPGSRNLTRVDALIGGLVVASQAFTSGAPNAAAPEEAPTTVVLSTNTAQVRENGGIFVPVIFNGNSAITANLFVQGTATPIASNAIPVVMNNPDAVIRRRPGTREAKLEPTNTSPSATSPGGNLFFKGTQTISGYDYLAFGRAVPQSVTLQSDICGASDNLVPAGATATSGIALTGTYSCAGVEGPNNVVETVSTTYAAGAVGPDGTPLTPPESSACGAEELVAGSAASALGVAVGGVSTVGSAFSVNNENRWNMFCPPVGAAPGPSFIDNLGPTVTIGNVAFNDAFDQQWVNAAYPFSQDISASDGGVGLAAGFPQARQYTDGTFVPPSAGCSSTVVTTGNDFPETTTSSNVAPNSADWGKRICTYAEDQLGNTSATGGSNYFGIDKFAPDVRIAGSTAATPSIAPATVPAVSSTANTTIFSIAVPFTATDAWGVEALDGRSGFNQNVVAGFPANESMTVLNPNNNPAATFTSQTAFTCGLTDALNVVLSDNYVRSGHLPGAALLDCGIVPAQPMYVWVRLNATDRAGNAGTEIVRNYAIDQYAAPVLASIGASTPLYTAGQPANFFLFGSDDLEIIEADLAIGYPNIATVIATLTSITKPLSAIAGAARWDQTLTNILTATTVTDVFFFGRLDWTCTGAAAPYAACAAADGKVASPNGAQYNNNDTDGDTVFENDDLNPTSVGAVAYDVASQSSGAPVNTTLLTAQTTDVAEQWSTADLVTWRVLTPTGTTVQAEHKASTSIVAPFFDKVFIVRGNVAGATSLIVCGEAPAPTLTDNGVNRFWTSTFNKPTSGPCFAATGNWGAIGVKGAAGLVTQLVP